MHHPVQRDDVASASLPHRSLPGLLRRIALTWPDLNLDHARLIDDGGDHQVVLLDGRLVVRFPREPDRTLALEAAALDILGRRIALAVPRYDLSPDSRFGRYRFLHGLPLTARRLARLDPARTNVVARQLGAFLSTLHAMKPNDVAPRANWPILWTTRQIAERGRRESLPRLERAFPPLAAKIERFYRTYERDAPDRETVVHADLVDEHILLRHDRRGLAAIIDFGDIGIGDPAGDFAGFWSYGARFVAAVMAAYEGLADASGLLARSRRAHARHRIDRLGDDLAITHPTMLSARAIELEMMLDHLER